MALSVLNATGSTNSSLNSVTSPAITTTSGSLIVVLLFLYNTSGAAANGDVTDSKSNAYTLIGSSLGGTNVAGIAAYRCTGTTRGTSHTFTGDMVNSNPSHQIAVIEFAGHDTTTPIVTATIATANDTTSPFDVTSGGAVPSGGAGVYGVCVSGASGSPAWTAPSGYTVAGSENDADTDLVYWGGYKLNETGTPTVGGSWAGTVGTTSPREIFFAVQAVAGEATAPIATITATTGLPAFTVTAEYTTPFVVTSNGAALTTNDPSVTFTGYTATLNDLVVLFISSATVLDLVVDASLPAGWFGANGSGVDVNSDAHGMCAVYHFVTQAEVDAATTTYTCTDALAAAETGYVQGAVVRNVDTTTPIDSANTAFDSGNSVTPHVLAGLTGTNLSTDSLVLSSVAKDGTGDYGASAPTGWTRLRNDNTNNGRWLGYRDALTVASTNVDATNITPSAGDEYCSITLALTKKVGAATAPLATITATTGIPAFTVSGAATAPVATLTSGELPAVGVLIVTIAPLATLTSTTELSAVTISASQTAPLATLSSTTELPAVTISASQTAPLATITTGELPAVTVSVGTSATAPLATITTGELPAVTISASQTAPLATLTITTDLPAVTISAGQTAPVATLTSITELPAVGVSTGTNVTAPLATLTVATRLPPVTTRAFLKSVSGRRLLDSFSNDVLIKTWSSWGLAQNLSNANITTHLEGVAARGFNAVTVMMFGYHPAVDWTAYTAGNGSAVFTGTAYQSSLGAGWGSMDHVVTEAHRLGLTVLMSIYTAFGTTGPRADMEAASNAQMVTFGEAVAARYLDYDNIVWHIGADDVWLTIHTIADRVSAFFEGVNNIEGTTRRPIRVAEPNNGDSPYNQWPTWMGGGEVLLSVNAWYDYGDTSVDIADTGFAEDVTRPVWDCEPPYRWAGHYGSTTTIEPQEIRERIYSTVIRGGVGINVGNEDSWPFGLTGLYSGGRTWQQTLTDPEAYWAQYAWDIFTLVGNTAGYTRDSGGFITSGLGTLDTKAASAYSTSKGVVYMPDSRSVTADLTEFSGSFANCRVRRYDPTDGSWTTLGTFATSGSQTITGQGTNASGTFSDWVLVFDQSPETTAPIATLTTGTLPAFTISAGQTAPLARLTSVTEFPAFTVSGAATAPLATLTATTELSAFTVTGAATALVATLTSTTELPAFGVQAGGSATAPLATLTVATETPTVTVQASQTAPLATITATTGLPAFTVSGTAVAPIAMLSSTTELPVVTVSASVTAPLATLTVTTSLPTIVVEFTIADVTPSKRTTTELHTDQARERSRGTASERYRSTGRQRP